MAILSTESLGPGFVKVNQDIIIEDTSKTQIVLKATMHEGGVRGDIIRYRKNAGGEKEDLTSINFNTLHENDSIKISLDTAATKKLIEALWMLERMLEEQGISSGIRRFEVACPDSIVITDQNKATVIRQLIEADYGDDVWDALVQSNPDIATRLANSRIHEKRELTLNQFENMLAIGGYNEQDWQNFFEEHTWIFGYGLRYQFLTVIQPQANYGGADVSGNGAQRGDFLTATNADVKYTCLVEIKRPDTRLLQNVPYRNAAWGISSELSGAISQVHTNCAEWEINGARMEENQELLAGINTVQPKGIIVVGNTIELDNLHKKKSFERFRRNIINPEIITYDELYERAKFIVDKIDTIQ